MKRKKIKKDRIIKRRAINNIRKYINQKFNNKIFNQI